MPEALAFFRGQIVPLSEARVNVMTHALHYGTAVFEGIRGNWHKGQGKLFIFRMREHYARFLQGCRMMMLNIPYTVDDLCSITIELLQSCGYKEDLYIRPLAYKSAEQVAKGGPVHQAPWRTPQAPGVRQRLHADDRSLRLIHGLRGCHQVLHLFMAAHG